MSKFYAVKKGRRHGIYTNWGECKAQVEGFKGAIYKAFSSYDEAKSFIKSDSSISEERDTINIIKTDNLDIDIAEAYVDGSYSDEYKMYSYGVVILHNNKEIKFSGKDNDFDNISMRNVAGELLGAIEAMKWASKNNVKKLKIYYDYQGIENWALGLWKTNKKGTRYYKKFFDSINKILEVNFIKVKAHTGVLYNEEADRLAKKEFSSIKIVDEIVSENKYLDIFDKIVNKEEIGEYKNNYFTIFRGNIITEKKLKKISKEIWKRNNRKISEISTTDITFNVDKKIIFIKIEDVNKNEYKYKITL